MENKEQPDISEFVKMIMPDASIDEQVQATMNWDRFLDVIDDIYERIVREREADRKKNIEGSSA